MSYMKQLIDEEEQYEPSEEEVRSANIHHTLNAVIDELKDMPVEWLDFRTLADAAKAINKKVTEKSIANNQ